MPWPSDWDRAHVLGALEEAARVSLSPNDETPDALIVRAQELGLLPAELRLFIFDAPNSWTTDELVRWARQYGLNRRERQC